MAIGAIVSVLVHLCLWLPLVVGEDCGYGTNCTVPDHWPSLKLTCPHERKVLVNETCAKIRYTCGNSCLETQAYNDLDAEPYFCYCDPHCLLYGDCCDDFDPKNCPNDNEEPFLKDLYALQTPMDRWTCLDNHYAVVSYCPEDWTHADHLSTWKLQEESTSDQVFRDLNILVTDKITGIHYINYTIYSCNRQRGSEPIFWAQTRKPVSTLDISFTTPYEQIPKPPENLQTRRCSTLYLFCSITQTCVLSGIPHASSICQKNRDYLLSYTEEMIESEAQNVCNILKTTGGKNIVEFTLLVTLSNDNSVKLTNNVQVKSVWKAAKCSSLSAKNCHLQNCFIPFFKMGQFCLMLKGIIISFRYFDLKPKDGRRQRDEAEFFDSARKRLVGQLVLSMFTRTVRQSRPGRLVHDIHYKVMRTTIADEIDLIPFTRAVKEELESNTTQTDTIVPNKLIMCFIMAYPDGDQLLKDPNSSVNLAELDPEFYCDHLSLSTSSNNSLTYTVKSSYEKNTPWDFGPSPNIGQPNFSSNWTRHFSKILFNALIALAMIANIL